MHFENYFSNRCDLVRNERRARYKRKIKNNNKMNWESYRGIVEKLK